MPRTLLQLAVVSVLLLIGSLASAQTTQPGDAIDLEVYNPIDGSNRFCVATSTTLEARVYLRPGSDSSSCTLSCSPPNVPGGSANIATAVVDLAFDSSKLSYANGSIESNSATTAIQGLAQEQNIGDGRIGWALAGTWSSPGNPVSPLLSPCEMQMITTANWIFKVEFQAVGTGMTSLHLRRESDTTPFALSFADICGTEAFKQSNGGIDEVRDAVVMVATDCEDVLFFDNFGSGDTTMWSDSAGF